MGNLQQSNHAEQDNEFPFGTIQHNVKNIPVTAAEINHLWLTYMAESMSETFQKFTFAKAEDPDYRNILSASLEVSSNHLQQIRNIFHSINHPIPLAFGDQDVNINAKRLYDETCTVRYVKMMNKFIIQNHALAIGECSRSDIRQLFSGFIDDSRKIMQKATDVLLAKGTYPKIPYIAIPDKVEFVDDKNYYGSFFGSDRPLNALEITNIVNLLDFKVVVKLVKLSFAQVCKSNDIRKFFNEGVNVADKHINILRSIIEKEGLSGPELIDYRITDSTESTFSDRLMLFHTTTIIAYILTAYGRGLSRTMRKDVAATFLRLMTEILTVAKDGADLLIKHGWLEKAPANVNRQELTH